MKLDTPKKRFWFVMACLWVSAWTIVYLMGAKFHGFKFVGWLLVAVTPVFLAWGAAAAYQRIAKWIRYG